MSPAISLHHSQNSHREREWEREREMKTRGRAAGKKRSAADLLASPPQGAANTSHLSTESPKSFEFKLNSPMTTTATAAGNRRRSVPPAVDSSPIRSNANVSSIDELKEMASSRLDSIKRQAERSHSDILKEVESSHARLHKRFKVSLSRFLSLEYTEHVKFWMIPLVLLLLLLLLCIQFQASFIWI